MARPSREDTMMQVAEIFAQRSTCDRLHVGAVMVREGRILVTGYNGAPAGLPHCVHSAGDGEGCTTAEHAERNAIAFAARLGIRLEGATLYVTHMPCLSCAMSIVNAGVDEVFYRDPYRLLDGIRLLEKADVGVYHYDRVIS